MGKTTIEICCGSVEDVLRAARAGAGRIELNSAMAVGGLTPTLGMLAGAKKFCDVPIICMVRPRSGGFCYSELEFETMLEDGKALMDAGADGLAFGCLDARGYVDAQRCRQLAEIAGEGAVFHKAFDAMAQSHEEALEVLISVGVKRILTSGGKRTAEEGIPEIKNLIALSRGRMEILPGGSIRGHNVRKIIEGTGCSQVHLRFHKSERDPTVGLNPDMPLTPNVLPEEDMVQLIDEKGLAEFIGFVNS